MIKIYPRDTLGSADYGWLKARYHFSFARYINRDRIGFGTLKVINDDIVKAGHGFDTHPHDNMEIITFVRKGAITHKDSQGNKGRTAAGDVQVMSAGSGIAHSEHNAEDEDTVLYQIWITPKEKDIPPRWDMAEFPKTPVKDELHLLVSGRAEDKDKGALYIHQDAAIYGGRIQGGGTITQAIKHQAYLLVSEGAITVNGQAVNAGDGAEITSMDEISITAKQDAQLLLIDVPG
ncbi:MAG: hypothetical protein CMH28_00370 [Micavibrio sp.]|nr:hypothetical protein [Micavibrio sp.]